MRNRVLHFGRKILSGSMFIILLCIGGTVAPSFAEEIRIPLGQQNVTPEWRSQQPERGMSKAQVESTYGAPDSRHGPNGDPAIYYWEYTDFTIYFEDNFVLHAVSKHLKNSAP